MGTSKRALTERAEEIGQEDDDIPLTQPSHDSTSPSRAPSIYAASELQAPLRTQDPTLVKGTGGPPEASATNRDVSTLAPVKQNPPALTRPQRWAATASLNLDIITYALLFICVGLPVYYAAGYAMPAQLSLNIIFYLLALRIPPKYKTFLHPVLVSSALTILGVWILALVRQNTLNDALHAYTTGNKYTQLWDQTHNLSAPGAGDVFGSVLDVSIVALGLPMFQYRNELRARFLTIVIPNISLSVGSLLGYPALCYAIGISAPRSLAFASRSLTLALATPATTNLHGDLYTIAPLCIFSGIVGVIVGPWALDALKIPQGQSIGPALRTY